MSEHEDWSPNQRPDETYVEDLEEWTKSWTPLRELQLILEGSRFGEVQGVKFDLRHPDLPDSEHWHCPSGAVPFAVAFPWDRLSAGGKEAAEELVTDGASKRGWKVTHVYEGDTVEIAKVLSTHGSGHTPLNDPRDSNVVLAYLQVRRANGLELIDGGSPIQFIARDAIGPYAPFSNWQSSLDDDFSEIAYQEPFKINLEKASLRTKRLVRESSRAGRYPLGGTDLQWLKLANEMSDAIDIELEERGAVGALGVIEMALALGYALAMAEVQRQVTHLAKKGIKAQATQKAATQASSRKRADPVRQQAMEYIAANPKTTQGQCVSAIAHRLGRSERSVARTISPLFEMKTLAGGAREKKPKIAKDQGSD
ncbi:MAG: hypothetical protein WCO83_10955 [Alphaproteobacteria bacterium]